ncbi:hypothetical protein KIN20_005473 [Parelaphostrongylus tenuis]|uniref:SEC7 domain-containing protein n=1 Tax=Parelaphostrongylus tenuis TaxID=148309 RepID=A0AAD5MIY0_PARTN|nr:hypothetical protein KIN20_005473 [Parelaphostrongylus tenuis]
MVMDAALQQTGGMFLRSAIERILADRDIKRKENLQLKKACENVLEELKGENYGGHNSNSGVLPDRERIVEADRYFLPFELACKSKSPKIVITALDCLQKLIAYGHLTGRGADSSNPDRKLIDRIVEAICSSFIGQGTDEAVLLQIIKAILAVVLANNCEVHEASLLLAVRTCFTIFLATKSPINQSTAKATLTQVINAVFSNMERVGNAKDDTVVISEVMEFLVTSVASTMSEDDGDESRNRCAGGGSSTSLGELEGSQHDDHIWFPNVEQKDAFLVFRSLCVLAQKDEGDLNDPRNTHLNSKMLALEMLLLVLQNSSTVLQNAQPFILLIKKSLCVALSRNAVSSNVKIFEKSLAIFVQLLDKFKIHLKLQIEVFFKEIIISMLESTSCSFEHKWIVLHTIGKILANPQAVVDLYVNYDCDLTAHNVFENLVDVVSKTARTAVNEAAPLIQKERERAMRLLGLSCLTDLLQCLVDWFDVCETTKESLYQGRTDDEDVTKEVSSSPTVDRFMHLKQKKELMEHGIMLFSRKPKQGLAFLQEHGFVGTEPSEIAEFLMKEDRLDKTVVGDFLGSPDEFSKQIMYAYIDDLDFSSRDFVSAIRLFLEKFRLPGEAQKIDRLMEKFASRYCECNPSLGLFASADTAYVLAYSIIMLTTDLHSPQVKNKMTKEQYVNMNRGINNGADLPCDFLCAIYDDIAMNEIKMKAGASKLLKSTKATSGDRQRRALATLELAVMSETARALMESASNAAADFTSAQHQHHVRPMFKICWTPCLAAFSVGLQMSDDIEEWFLCIRGFRLGIRAACVLRSRLERNAFIQALARFTLLTAKNALGEMKEKNIEAIKLLLAIGDEDGDYLEENWFDVIRCISQLELAQLIGTGLGTGTKEDKESSRQYVMKSTGALDERTLATLQGALGETSSQAVVVAVDRIFQGSCRLTSDAIVFFVRALCLVSKEELNQPAAPRMFLLGKLVEVAFYNMGRIRLEWRRVWEVVGEHFNMAGCNASEVVAHYSVDALRQLAIKFLERGELPNFRFQKDFLRPFEVIMAKNRSAPTRELVVACCSNLVEAHACRIKSGWQNLFSVWTLAAGDVQKDIVEAAFLASSKVIQTQFKEDFASVLDAFQDALKCLAEFACNTHHPDMNMEAIRLIRSCAEYVSMNQEKIIDSPWEESWNVSGDQRIWLRGWFPIFFELSCIINRCKLDVRTRSLTVMFEIMKNYGNEFRPEWWRDLFNIVFRIFDHAKLDENHGDKKEWMMTTCNHAMYAIVDVFTQYYPQLSELVLPSIYEQFTICIQQKNEQLARSTVNCLETLILLNGGRFTNDMWERTVQLFRRLFAATLPKSPEFDDYVPNSDGRPNGSIHPDAAFSEQIVFCVVQSELVDAVTSTVLGTKRNSEEVILSIPSSKSKYINGFDSNESIHNGLFNTMNPILLLSLCDALGESQRLAKQFNDNNGQRTLLWKAGLRGSSKPNLIRQETHALRAMLAILLRLLNDPRSECVWDQVTKGVLSVVSAVLRGYGEATSDARRTAYAPVVCELLQECLHLPAHLLPSLGSEFPLHLCELVETAEGQPLRSLLATLLRQFLLAKNASSTKRNSSHGINGS